MDVFYVFVHSVECGNVSALVSALADGSKREGVSVDDCGASDLYPDRLGAVRSDRFLGDGYPASAGVPQGVWRARGNGRYFGRESDLNWVSDRRRIGGDHVIAGFTVFESRDNVYE